MEPQVNASVVLMEVKSRHRNDTFWVRVCLGAAEQAQLAEMSSILFATKGREKSEEE